MTPEMALSNWLHAAESGAEESEPSGILEALAAAGYAVVPLEPTEAMIAAAEVAVLSEGLPDFPGDKRVITMSAKLTREEARATVQAALAAAKADPA